MDTSDQNVTTTTNTGNSNNPDYQGMYTDLMGKINSGEFFTKAVYTGLQQTHEKEVGAHKAAKAELATAQAQIKELTDKIGTLETGSQSILEAKKSLEDQLTTTSRKLKRSQLVMSKFPHLAQWEAEGLLPDAPEDQLETVFKAIGDRLATTNTQARQQQVAGASALDSSASAVVEVSANVLLKEANDALVKGDQKTYNEKFEAYLKAKAKK
jgi:hypothetical protein